MNTQTSQAKFDQYCVVELFGHNRIAGRVSEQEIGGQTFIRVDVPATRQFGAYTKFFGAGAIYALTPTDETTCKLAAESFRVAPVELWRLDLPQQALLEPRTDLLEESDWDDDGEPWPEYGDDENEDGDAIGEPSIHEGDTEPYTVTWSGPQDGETSATE